MPTWGWYAIGAGVFVLVYLYFHSSQQQTANPIGSVASTVSPLDQYAYNSVTNVATDILSIQQTEKTQVAQLQSKK